MTAIIFRHLPDGGFVAGDPVSRVTAYAYPTSIRASQAKTNPAAAAASMIGVESSWNGRALSAHAAEFDRRNWAILAPQGVAS